MFGEFSSLAHLESFRFMAPRPACAYCTLQLTRRILIRWDEFLRNKHHTSLDNSCWKEMRRLTVLKSGWSSPPLIYQSVLSEENEWLVITPKLQSGVKCPHIDHIYGHMNVLPPSLMVYYFLNNEGFSLGQNNCGDMREE